MQQRGKNRDWDTHSRPQLTGRVKRCRLKKNIEAQEEHNFRRLCRLQDWKGADDATN